MSVLPAVGAALQAGIGAQDHLCTAAFEAWQLGEMVSAAGEFGGGGIVVARFQPDGPAPYDPESGSVDGLLGGHTPVEDVTQYLQLPLRLHEPADHAETAAKPVPVAEHRGNDGVIRAFTALGSIRVRETQGETVSTVVQQYSASRCHHPGTEALV